MQTTTSAPPPLTHAITIRNVWHLRCPVTDTSTYIVFYVLQVCHLLDNTILSLICFASSRDQHFLTWRSTLLFPSAPCTHLKFMLLPNSIDIPFHKVLHDYFSSFDSDHLTIFPILISTKSSSHQYHQMSHQALSLLLYIIGAFSLVLIESRICTTRKTNQLATALKILTAS